MLFYIGLIVIVLVLLLALLGILYTINKAITNPKEFMTDEFQKRFGIRVNL